MAKVIIDVDTNPDEPAIRRAHEDEVGALDVPDHILFLYELARKQCVAAERAATLAREAADAYEAQVFTAAGMIMDRCVGWRHPHPGVTGEPC